MSVCPVCGLEVREGVLIIHRGEPMTFHLGCALYVQGSDRDHVS